MLGHSCVKGIAEKRRFFPLPGNCAVAEKGGEGREKEGEEGDEEGRERRERQREREKI